MKQFINNAKNYIANPANKEQVAIATGVAIGVAIVPLTIKCLAATAMGITAKAAIGIAIGSAAGYGAYKGIEALDLDAIINRAEHRESQS